MTQQMERWISRPRRLPDARVRLICCPHAGVGASAFARWASELPAWAEVACLQPPGRETRFAEPAIASTTALAWAAADALAPLLDGPFALFGHSFGAVVAYEMARAWRAQGLGEPLCLFVSGSRAPFEPWPHPPIAALDDVALSAEIERRYGTPVPAAVIASAELRELFLPPLRADLRAVESHRHEDGAPLGCRVSALAGAGDPMATESEVAEWRHATTGPFRLRVFERGHFFVKTATADVLSGVTRDLQEALLELDGRQMASGQPA